jgi:hypothetical protein
MKILNYKAAIAAIALLALVTQAQGQNIPQNVGAAFSGKYPSAKLKKWKMKDALYIASFKEDGKNASATFDQHGSWLETDLKMSGLRQLPSVVKQTYDQHKQSAWNIYAVTCTEKPSGILYQIKADDANRPVDAYHQSVVPQDWLIEIDQQGKWIAARDLNKQNRF